MADNFDDILSELNEATSEVGISTAGAAEKVRDFKSELDDVDETVGLVSAAFSELSKNLKTVMDGIYATILDLQNKVMSGQKLSPEDIFDSTNQIFDAAIPPIGNIDSQLVKVQNVASDYIYGTTEKAREIASASTKHLNATEQARRSILKNNREIEKSYKEMSQKVVKSVDKILPSFQKWGIAVGIVIGAYRQIKGVVSDLIDNFLIQEKVERQLESVIRSTKKAAGLAADEIKRYAAELQGVTAYGDEATIASANLLLTFTNIKGQQFKDAQQTILDVAQAMGTLESATLQVGKALNAPTSNLGALGRVGIQFSREQKELIKRFEETNQLAEAQKIILKELQTQFGGSAQDYAKTTEGRLKSITNSVGDMLETFGKNLTESKVFQGILDNTVSVAQDFFTITNKFLPIIDNLVMKVIDGTIWFGKMVVAAHDLAKTLVEIDFNPITAFFRGMERVVTVIEKLGTLVGTTATMIGPILSTLWDLLSAFIDKVWEYAKVKFMQFMNFFTNVKDIYKDGWNGIANVSGLPKDEEVDKSGLNKASGKVKQQQKRVANILELFWDSLTEDDDIAKKGAKKAAKKTKQDAITVIGKMPWYTGVLVGLRKTLKTTEQIFIDFFVSLKGSVQSAFEDFLDFSTGLQNNLGNLFKNIGQGIFDSFKTGLASTISQSLITSFASSMPNGNYTPFTPLGGAREGLAGVGAAPKMSINVNNNTPISVGAGNLKYDNKNNVLNVTLNAANNNPRYRQSVRR